MNTMTPRRLMVVALAVSAASLLGVHPARAQSRVIRGPFGKSIRVPVPPRPVNSAPGQVAVGTQPATTLPHSPAGGASATAIPGGGGSLRPAQVGQVDLEGLSLTGGRSNPPAARSSKSGRSNPPAARSSKSGTIRGNAVRTTPRSPARP